MNDSTLNDLNLAVLKAELERADLQVYLAVVMARRDFEAGNADSALARLRVDADKLRCHDTAINRLLMGR